MTDTFEHWENELEQDENRGQDKFCQKIKKIINEGEMPTPRKAWKFGKFDNDEDGNANP